MFFEIYFSFISSSLIFEDMHASTDPIEQNLFSFIIMFLIHKVNFKSVGQLI